MRQHLAQLIRHCDGPPPGLQGLAGQRFRPVRLHAVRRLPHQVIEPALLGGPALGLLGPQPLPLLAGRQQVRGHPGLLLRGAPRRLGVLLGLLGRHRRRVAPLRRGLGIRLDQGDVALQVFSFAVVADLLAELERLQGPRPLFGATWFWPFLRPDPVDRFAHRPEARSLAREAARPDPCLPGSARQLPVFKPQH